MGFEVISYKFVAASALTAAKTLVYRMTPQRAAGAALESKAVQQNAGGSLENAQLTPQRASDATLESKAATQDTGGSLVGVQPIDALGKFFETSLTLGLTENTAQDFEITEAVCSVSLVKNIVKTSLVGMNGTVKEYINTGDYDITIAVGLVAVEDGNIVDKYPEQGVRDLRALLERNEALYVCSDFLHLFDITRMVVTDYSIEQMTHSNRQVVTIKAISDEDYVIKANEG